MNHQSITPLDSDKQQPTAAQIQEGPNPIAADANAGQSANQHRESPTLASEATAKTNTRDERKEPENPDQAFNRWQLYTLNDALTAEDVPWDWAIDGLLLRQAALLCSGQPHAGKSLNWLAAAMGSVIEHKVWGHFDASRVKRVLFIETEDPKQVLDKRIQQLAKGFGVDPGKLADVGFFYARPGPFDITHPAFQKQLTMMITNCKPDWCVISTLQGLIPGKNWKEQLDMAPVNAFVVDLASKCCPIVMITHSPQDKSAKRAAGTITQEANYLTVMHFEKKGLVTSVTVDSKIGESMKFDVTLEVDGKEVRAVQHSEAVQSRQQAVIELRKANPDVTQKQIAELAKCSLRTVQLADAELKKAEGRATFKATVAKMKADKEKLKIYSSRAAKFIGSRRGQTITIEQFKKEAKVDDAFLEDFKYDAEKYGRFNGLVIEFIDEQTFRVEPPASATPVPATNPVYESTAVKQEG